MYVLYFYFVHQNVYTSECMHPPTTQQEVPARDTAALVTGVCVTLITLLGVAAWQAALAAQKKLQ